MSKHTYIPCDPNSIPANVRFDIPGRNAGQAVEVAYGGFDRAEHDAGDMYKRVTDHGIGAGAVTYYILATKS